MRTGDEMMKQATVYRVRSETVQGNYYEVMFFSDGSKRCECPAFRYSTGDRCKHIDRLVFNGKGFVNNQSPVWRVLTNDNEVVLTGTHDLHALLEKSIDSLDVGGSVTVERLA